MCVRCVSICTRVPVTKPLNYAAGMCANFNPRDPSFYIVGTEEGFVHKCSVSYNEQVLTLLNILSFTSTKVYRRHRRGLAWLCAKSALCPITSRCALYSALLVQKCKLLVHKCKEEGFVCTRALCPITSSNSFYSICSALLVQKYILLVQQCEEEGFVVHTCSVSYNSLYSALLEQKYNSINTDAKGAGSIQRPITSTTHFTQLYSYKSTNTDGMGAGSI